MAQITWERPPVRRLSAPRERTLTELGLRDTRFDAHRDDVPHHMLTAIECRRLECATHEIELTFDCGD